jgi:putative ABC transport system permease protein
METLNLSARLARSRPGETLIAVLGVALGVGALVGVATLIRGYDEYQTRLARNPLSREITVSGFRGQQDSSAAVVPVDASRAEPVRLSLGDGAKAKAEIEGLDAIYQYQSRRFSTAALSGSNARAFAMAQGGPGGGPGPGGDFAPPPGGAQSGGGAPSVAATAIAAGTGSATGAASGAAALGGAVGSASGTARGAAVADATADPFQTMMQEQAAALAEAAKVPVDEVTVEELRGMVVSPSFFGAYELEAAQGSLFDDKDVSARSNVAVVGASLAKTLYAGQEALGKRIRLNGSAYSIIGVLAADPWEDGTRQVPFDDMIFTPQQSRSFTTPDGQTIAIAFGADNLSIMAAAGQSPAKAGKNLQAWFDRSYGEGKVRVGTAAARFQREVTQRKGILFVLTILAGAAAAAAAVNLFNIMAGRVLKRSRSYGIMRAVGAPSGTVFASIMAETTIAAGAGALLSLLLSPFLFFALEGALTAAAGDSIPVRLDPIYLVIATLVSAAVAVLLVAAPASSAARAPIADALKTE